MSSLTPSSGRDSDAAAYTDPPAFNRFKRSARSMHEAGKIGDARRKIIGSRINDPELRAAVASIDAWLARQPEHVQVFALTPRHGGRVIPVGDHER